ncbi:hypothetical protein BW731_11785 [Vagococcus martis]|uniref:Uncharacterized protein n=1 Tax=Vagococcus martis TaxID=1768210 RepID=A0A1V4DK49_9ENTE|nr:hypothetical protein [Vagococcus martis]OPF88802.1 hypothetical protein BW731_11785 [Vagococcus martis]
MLDSKVNHNSPKFQLKFYVKDTYVAETVDGDLQFIRKYRRKFNEVKALFCKEYGKVYNYPDTIENDDSLDLMITTVKALQSRLEKSFLIPGSIELHTIELIGNWEVFNGKNDSALVKEYEEQLFNNFKKFGLT